MIVDYVNDVWSVEGLVITVLSSLFVSFYVFFVPRKPRWVLKIGTNASRILMYVSGGHDVCCRLRTFRFKQSFWVVRKGTYRAIREVGLCVHRAVLVGTQPFTQKHRFIDFKRLPVWSPIPRSLNKPLTQCTI